jgi:hypothetical protein
MRRSTRTASVLLAALLPAGLAAQPPAADGQKPAAAPQPTAAPAPAAPAAAASPCALPEMRQFDFWVGEWELVSRFRRPDGTWTDERATDSVHPVLNGCALYQDWKGTVAGEPLHGVSLTSYAPDRHQWQQAWSDDSGPSLYDFTGGMEGDRMVLSRQVTVDGKSAVRRQVFQNIQPDAFDWAYEQSLDSGKSWAPLWTIRYTRKRP